jgi:hypothetical protein
MKKSRKALLRPALTMFNVDVPAGVNVTATSRRWFSPLLRAGAAASFLLLGACSGDATRVRLEFRVDNEAFRPEYIVVWWQTGEAERESRVPNAGVLSPQGNVLGSALISLSDKQPVQRRFIARGFRGSNEMRVSGAVAQVQWSSGRESSVIMTLGCYDDPEPKYAAPLPGCPSTGTPDAGAPDAAPDAAGDTGADTAGDGASDKPRD